MRTNGNNNLINNNLNEDYIENLIIRYNPNTSMVKELNANRKTDFIKEIMRMITKLTSEATDKIENQYKYEIDCWWDGPGVYLVYLQDYGLNGVAVDVRQL